jgi:hypothetical protein
MLTKKTVLILALLAFVGISGVSVSVFADRLMINTGPYASVSTLTEVEAAGAGTRTTSSYYNRDHSGPHSAVAIDAVTAEGPSPSGPSTSPTDSNQ